MSDEVNKYMCSPATAIAGAVFFMFKTGEALLEPTARLLITNGVCLQEIPNETHVCHNLSMFEDRENHVQLVSAYYLTAYKIALNLPTLLLALFCGAWSDQIGRKTPMVLSAVGTLVSVIFYLTGRFFMASASIFFAFIFLASTLRGISGKGLMQMAMESFVSDVSSETSRTYNLSKMLSMNFFGYFLGSVLAGVLLQFTDYAYLLSAVIILNAVCIVIIVIYLEESVKRHPIPENTNQLHVESDSAIQLSTWKSKNPFRWTHIKDSLNVIVKPRNHHNRAHLLLLFAIIFVQQATKSGENDVTVLYTTKSPLSWSDSTYGYFVAADYACLGLASAFITPILVTIFNLKDTTLCMIAVVSKITRLALMSYGQYTWVMFLSVVVGSPNAFIVSSGKSMITKIVDSDEIGKSLSLLSFLETVANFVGSLVFAAIYAMSFEFFGGLVFIIQACLMALVGVAVVWLIYEEQRSKESHSYVALDERNVNGTISDVDQLKTADALSAYGTIDQSPRSKR